MNAIYDGTAGVGLIDQNLLLKSAAKDSEKLSQVGVWKFGEGAYYSISDTCMDIALNYFEQAELEIRRVNEDLRSGLCGSEK